MKRVREEDGTTPATTVVSEEMRRKAVIEEVEQCYDGQIEDVAELRATLGTLDDGELYRKPSTVFHGAFPGLFSRRSYRAGDLITWYSGARVSKEYYDRTLKRQDPEYYTYSRALTFTEIILGNYTRDPDTGVLRKVRADELGEVFRGDGAGQFANGGATITDRGVNVADVTIEERRRKVAADSTDIVGDTFARRAAYPDGVLSVMVALTDIPANTELITSYGPAVVAKMSGKSAAAASSHSIFRRHRTLNACAECCQPAKFACGRCVQVFYCSDACQVAHAMSADCSDACLI